jgi:hypothetical protein
VLIGELGPGSVALRPRGRGAASMSRVVLVSGSAEVPGSRLGARARRGRLEGSGAGDARRSLRFAARGRALHGVCEGDIERPKSLGGRDGRSGRRVSPRGNPLAGSDGRALALDETMKSPPLSLPGIPGLVNDPDLPSDERSSPGLSGFVLAGALVVPRTEGCPARATSVSVQGTGGFRRHDWQVCGVRARPGKPQESNRFE